MTDCLTICEKLLVSYDLDINELLAGAKRTALQVGWSQAESVPVPEPAPNTKLSITRSIFELEAQNFACK